MNQYNETSTLQYMGSKARIISHICDPIIKNKPIRTVVDLFAGTDAVGYGPSPLVGGKKCKRFLCLGLQKRRNLFFRLLLQRSILPWLPHPRWNIGGHGILGPTLLRSLQRRNNIFWRCIPGPYGFSGRHFNFSPINRLLESGGNQHRSLQ